MSQSQPQTIITQPELTPVTVDLTPLLEHGESPTAIILAIAILLWILRPVMLKQILRIFRDMLL